MEIQHPSKFPALSHRQSVRGRPLPGDWITSVAACWSLQVLHSGTILRHHLHARMSHFETQNDQWLHTSPDRRRGREYTFWAPELYIDITGVGSQNHQICLLIFSL